MVDVECYRWAVSVVFLWLKCAGFLISLPQNRVGAQR
jgi:hypothetical protein